MISVRLRRLVRSVYGGCCGYCGVCDEDVGAELTVDHFQPLVHSGANTQENLGYCCPACNAFKSDYWPDDSTLRLLHPARVDIGEHLSLDSTGRRIGLTGAGERQISVLHLNRPALVRHRFLKQERRLESLARAELQRELERIERRLQALEKRLSAE